MYSIGLVATLYYAQHNKILEMLAKEEEYADFINTRTITI